MMMDNKIVGDFYKQCSTKCRFNTLKNLKIGKKRIA